MAIPSQAGLTERTPSGSCGAAEQPSTFAEAAAETAAGSGAPGGRAASTGATPGSRQSAAGMSSLGAGLRNAALTASDAIRQQTGQYAREIGHELNKTGEGHKARGVDALRQFARVVDRAASELEDQSPTVARTVHEAARRVDGLSDNISKRDVSELVDSAAEMARAQPALFFGGAVAAGFALARFLKSSSRNGASRAGEAESVTGASYASDRDARPSTGRVESDSYDSRSAPNPYEPAASRGFTASRPFER